MTTAAANAKAAGMTLFVSSGNDGYCDSMGWPGCLSDVISVGAVFDGSLGTLGWCWTTGSCAAKTSYVDCEDTGYIVWNSTAADVVTSYSNSASFLDLFAPSHNAYTTTNGGGYNTSFGGTSAACPYAAGAGAALQSAAKVITGSYMTPAALELNLTSNGDLITDNKVAITKPRVNLGDSIADLGDGGPAVFFSNTTYFGEEDGGPITVTVNLGAAPSNTVTVDYESGDVTAIAGSDYTTVSGTLTFGQNETSKTFTVTPINDILGECSETLIIILSNPTNATIGDINQATIHINDDDSNNICSLPSITIPDNSILGISDSIMIPTSGSLTYLNVDVNVSHTWVGDLVFTLTHEDTGTSVTIIDRPGMLDTGNGCSLDDIDVTLDDEATSFVEDECSTDPPTINGIFKPNNPLSAFDSENLSGTWTLMIFDNASQDTGTLNSWGLEPTMASFVNVDGLSSTTLSFDSIAIPDSGTSYFGIGGVVVTWQASYGSNFHIDIKTDNAANADGMVDSVIDPGANSVPLRFNSPNLGTPGDVNNPTAVEWGAIYGVIKDTNNFPVTEFADESLGHSKITGDNFKLNFAMELLSTVIAGSYVAPITLDLVLE